MHPDAEVATPRAASRHLRTTRASIAGFILFVGLTLAVDARVFAHADWVVVRAVAGWRQMLFDDYLLAWQVLDFVSVAISVVLSAELSVVYAVVASVLLWRAGRGRWALAPLAFVLLVPIEMNLKVVVDEPFVAPAAHGIRFVPPREWRRPTYPLTSVRLSGAFPSGHASRTGFLATFAGLLLWQRRGRAKVVGLATLVVLVALSGFTRIYVRDHWSSDVVAGLLLGSSLALLVAPAVVYRRVLPLDPWDVVLLRVGGGVRRR